MAAPTSAARHHLWRRTFIGALCYRALFVHVDRQRGAAIAVATNADDVAHPSPSCLQSPCD